jgi:lysophospholipid acyltransferase (LPLAT)-like uncharacterized protein
MKKWWRSARGKLLPGLIYFVARLIGKTLRIRVVGLAEIESLPGGKILAGWHGKTFVAANYFKGKGVWTIISQSRDGEAQDRIFRKFGFKTIRGSTGRGGVRAAVEAIKVLRQGAMMAFTPDGPRGPSGVVQGGIMLMAQKSGAALVAAGVSANRRWLLGTWDRYMIPKPFSKAIMIFGDPIYVPADADEAKLEELRLQLENDMHRLEAEADRRMGHGQ